MVCFTVILFCMAALIFPIGFYINEVGGQPYKLPNNTVVGSSYVLFVLSIFFTIVGLLFAGKVCLPGWWMSKLLDSFIIFNFILFFYFWRVGRTKARHLSSPHIGRCLDETDAEKKKKCFDLFSLCTLDLKTKIRRAFSITKYRQYWLNLLSIFRQSGLHCDSNLVKENALYRKACGPLYSVVPFLTSNDSFEGGKEKSLSIYESWRTRGMQKMFMWGWPHLLRN